MIATSIIIALVVLIGALLLHMSYTFGELKGYDRGLDDAEQIVIDYGYEALQRNKD